MRRYDGARLGAELEALVERCGLDGEQRRRMRGCVRDRCWGCLDAPMGATLQQRWEVIERDCWPAWDAGVAGRAPVERWTLGSGGTGALARGRARAGRCCRVHGCRSGSAGWRRTIRWRATRRGSRADGRGARGSGDECAARGHLLGAAAHAGRAATDRLREITDEDLCAVPVRGRAGPATRWTRAVRARGVGAHAAARRGSAGCASGASRRASWSRGRGSPSASAQCTSSTWRPTQQRISDVYATTRHKHNSLEHLWCFLDERYPEVAGCRRGAPRAPAGVHPEAVSSRARGAARAAALAGERGSDDRAPVAGERALLLRRLCTWALEHGSPFAQHAPPAVPLERHDLRNVGFEKARRRAAERDQRRPSSTSNARCRACARSRVRRWQEPSASSPQRRPRRGARAGGRARSGTGRS